MGTLRKIIGPALLVLIGGCPILAADPPIGSVPSRTVAPALWKLDATVQPAQAAPPLLPTPSPSPSPSPSPAPTPTPTPAGVFRPSSPAGEAPRLPAARTAPPAARPTGAGLAALGLLSPTTLAPPMAGPSLTGPEAFPLAGVPQMLGDMAPIFGRQRGMPTPSGTNLVRLPWVRGYKMADNQSPLPLDRVFATFYYYNDINVGPGLAARAGVSDVDVYREFFGFEKTFFNRHASVGMRLPLNTITADVNRPGPGISSTALGDLTVFGKYALWGDITRGEVISLGLAVTPPTGPAEFAGAEFTKGRNPTYLQPFVGYLKSAGRWYVQGFVGTNVPTDSRVVTMLYNDIGVGNYLYQSPRADALISAIVPSMEVHVNTPLNHRGGFSDVSDPGATFDSVNLTFGLSTVLRQRSVLSVGFVQSVTGPRPFDHEVILLLNVFLGRSPNRPPVAAPPLFGG